MPGTNAETPAMQSEDAPGKKKKPQRKDLL
jgi:hypothetical protein